MIIVLLIGLVLTAVAVVLVARAVSLSRVRTTETLNQIGQYGFAGAPERAHEPGVRGIFDDFAGAIGGFVVGTLGLFNEEELKNQLLRAGMYRLSPRMLMGYQVLFAILFPLFWGWLSTVLGFSGVVVVLGFVAAVFLGWLAPVALVKRRGEDRMEQIDYDLPELIDLLVVTVEAGVGFTGSMQLASERFSGPLGSELRLTMQEQRFGLTTLEALEHFAQRCPTPAVQSFVRSMVQGERLGVSVGEILRSLALEMRKRRRATAEERAHKAPIKILFPLIFLIFPAMFLVILGPAVYAVFDAINGG
jgi:tight adherence protein C